MNDYGVSISKGPSDWQICQTDGRGAELHLEGTWGYDSPVPHAAVMVRVVRESDNMPVVNWQSARMTGAHDDRQGSWELELFVPQGGLYRLETGLDTGWDRKAVWLARGDLRLHIGVGNLFVIAGQSNAAGYGRDPAWDPPALEVHSLRNNGRWDLAVHPLNESTEAADRPNAEGGVGGTSPYLAFGRRYAAESGLPVGLIPTAIGSTEISQWLPEAPGGLYENIISRIGAAGGRVAGILWYQGCSDTRDPQQADAYADRFEEIVYRTRRQLKACVPFFTFQLNRRTDGYDVGLWRRICEAQRCCAQRIPDVYLMPTIGTGLSDQVHNSSSGNVRLGEDLARQCAGVLLKGQAWQPPAVRRAVCRGCELSLEIDHVRFGLEEYQQDPGTLFHVRDEQGEIPVLGWEMETVPIRLRLQRQPGAGAVIGYDPLDGGLPIRDSATWLPLVIFAGLPIYGAEE